MLCQLKIVVKGMQIEAGCQSFGERKFRGSVSGATTQAGLVNIEENFAGSRLDYTGLELSIGLIFSNR